MKLRIAMWTEPGGDLGNWSMIWTDRAEGNTHKIRRTEYVEVDFPELSREVTIHHELDALAEMEKAVLVESNQKLQAIKDQRAKLLAITDARAVA